MINRCIYTFAYILLPFLLEELPTFLAALCVLLALTLQLRLRKPFRLSQFFLPVLQPGYSRLLFRLYDAAILVVRHREIAHLADSQFIYRTQSVQNTPVVTYHHNRGLRFRNEIVYRLPALSVKMIRRLVHQYQLRLVDRGSGYENLGL